LEHPGAVLVKGRNDKKIGSQIELNKDKPAEYYSQKERTKDLNTAVQMQYSEHY